MTGKIRMLDKNRSGLLVVDIQKKLIGGIQNSDQLIDRLIKLINGFKIINQPIFLTEQNPDGLGKTEPVIKKAVQAKVIYEKSTFSCCGVKGFTRTLRTHKINQIVLCGLETHICIWQTAADLISDGFEVVVVADAVSSRNETDKDIALMRMAANQIQISTVETVLFELIRQSGTEEFDQISKLVN